MTPSLVVGTIIFTGFIFGRLAERIKLPRVTGYILAGILLNPRISNFMPGDFVKHTDLITNISLSFITFSIGGTLLYSRIKKLGKSIISITLCEAEFSFIAIVLGFLVIAPFFIHVPGTTFLTAIIPLCILIGSLGSPTDPTPVLAITHEYKASGKVTTTMLSAAAFDDALGLINYSLAIVIARVLIMHTGFSLYSTVLNPLIIIAASLILGVIFGFVFNVASGLAKGEPGGVLIVLVFGLLSLCFGAATLLGLDELLTTMTMGIVVVNFHPERDRIFEILRLYAEEIIFVLFFTLSAMHLNFSVLKTCFILVIFFAIFRTIGKILGVAVGAIIGRSSPEVRKYAAGGLIPHGGIVIGMALMIKQNPAFSAISDIILSVIIGATVVHELFGPIFAKLALKKAGEIKD